MKKPEDRVVKENVYLTGGDSAKIKEKYGSLTAALRQLLFDMAVQGKVEEALADPNFKKETKRVFNALVERNKAVITKEKVDKQTKSASNFLENRRKSKLKIE